MFFFLCSPLLSQLRRLLGKQYKHSPFACSGQKFWDCLACSAAQVACVIVRRKAQDCLKERMIFACMCVCSCCCRRQVSRNVFVVYKMCLIQSFSAVKIIFLDFHLVCIVIVCWCKLWLLPFLVEQCCHLIVNCSNCSKLNVYLI